MPRPKKNKPDIEKEKSQSGASKKLLSNFLDEHKKDHLNFVTPPTYQVSTGSLEMDLHTGGGFRPGLYRSSGTSEAGKTNFGLTVMYNFLKEPKRKGIYINAEGRFTPELREKYGYFVNDPADWEEGTCFVFNTNVFEAAFGFIKKTIMNNPEGIQYHYIVDSVDALNLRNDLEGDFEKAGKVSGSALLSSKFLGQMNSYLVGYGHLLGLISQVRQNNIQISQFQKMDLNTNMVNAAGGNAIIHYSNWTLEFQPRFAKDEMFSDADAALKKEGKKPKGRPFAHFCRIRVKKSTNDSTGTEISYPVLHNRKGNSVWIEDEIAHNIRALYCTQNASWYTIHEDFLKGLAKDGFKDVPQKFQGDKLRDIITEDEKLRSYLYDKLKIWSED